MTLCKFPLLQIPGWAFPPSIPMPELPEVPDLPDYGFPLKLPLPFQIPGWAFPPSIPMPEIPELPELACPLDPKP